MDSRIGGHNVEFVALLRPHLDVSQKSVKASVENLFVPFGTHWQLQTNPLSRALKDHPRM
jgi:hypothetical protein